MLELIIVWKVSVQGATVMDAASYLVSVFIRKVSVTVVLHGFTVA